MLSIGIIENKWNTCSDKLEELSEQAALTVINFIRLYEDIDFSKPLSVNVCLSNDKEVRVLNKEFRGKDKATNVLSFANIDDDNFARDIEIFDEIALGDIIIAYETVEKEAKEKNIPFINHYIHLLVHGILHLLGFDHLRDEEANEMEKLETSILQILSIDNPYMENIC